MARKSISILDNDYIGWIKELSSRYRRSQIKVATKVNAEMLRFYWELGRDIVEMQIENRWGEGVIKNLSSDLQRELPGTHCFSRTNLYYMKKFYLLYRHHVGIVQQVAGQLPEEPEAPKVQQIAGLLQKKLSLAENSEAYSAKLESLLFSLPWGHHMLIIDKCSDDPQKALFFIRNTIENGRLRFQNTILRNSIQRKSKEQFRLLRKLRKDLKLISNQS